MNTSVPERPLLLLTGRTHSRSGENGRTNAWGSRVGVKKVVKRLRLKRH